MGENNVAIQLEIGEVPNDVKYSTHFIIAQKGQYAKGHFAGTYTTADEALSVINSDKFLLRNKGDDYDEYYRNMEYEIVEVTQISKIYHVKGK